MAAESTELGDYFRQAESWHEETYRKVKASRRRAWYAALAALMLACASTLTLAIVAPRHQVEIVPVLVNSTSGEVHVLQSLRDSTLSSLEAVRKADLATYVIARESYDPNRTLLARWYEAVQARSTEPTFSRYAGAFQGPDSVFARYKDAPREISVKSVVLLDTVTGQVRYGASLHSPGGDVRSDWIATLTFSYDSQTPVSLDQRLRNPLGFEVSAYRSDAESAPDRASP